MAPRKPHTITSYAVHILDNSREEYALNRDQKHREAAGDDPWLSPGKSEAVQALAVLLTRTDIDEGAIAKGVVDSGLDLRWVYKEAGLTEKQMDAMLMFGEGWGPSNIAFMLGITRDAVMLRLHNGRRKLTRLVLPVDKTSENSYYGLGSLSLER